MASAFLLFAEEGADIEVVVTAARDVRKVTDIPADVTLIEREKIEDMTVVQALEAYAGISFISYNGNDSQAAVSMRGFGENSHGRVLVLVDGIKQNDPDMSAVAWSALPLSAIERIEVFQGGASALYGGGCAAGVINIITRRPDRDRGIAAEAETEISSFKGHSEKWFISGSGKKISYYISGNTEDTEGWRERSGYDSKQAAGKISWDISDFLDAEFYFSVFSSEYEMAGALAKEIFDHDPKKAANDNDDASLGGLSALLSLSCAPSDDWALKFNGGYRYKTAGSDMESFSSWSDTDLHSFFISPSASYDFYPEKFSDSLNFGFDLFSDILISKGYGDRARDTKIRDNDVIKTGAGVFIRNDFRMFDDALTISLGAREDCEIISAKFGELSSAEDDDTAFFPFSCSAGINYLFPDSSNLYFRYDRVYRTPFTDEQVDYQGYGEGFNSDLDPEYGNSFEAGFNFNYLEGFSLGVSGYILLMKDEIAYNNTDRRNENMNDTIHCGINAKASYDFNDIFSLFASYAWTSAEFASGDHEGNKIPLVPEHKFSIVPSLSLPFGFFLSAEFIYTGSFYIGSDYENCFDKNDARLLTNFLCKYTFKSPCSFSLRMQINNVFDVGYASCAYTGYDPSFNKIATYYPGTGREFLLGASLSY